MIDKLALSYGKDSSTILIKNKEEKLIDYKEYIFADTGYEFPELYEYGKFLEKEFNIKVTHLLPKLTIEQFMKTKITRGDRKGQYRGFPLKFFPCAFMRETKIKPIDQQKKICRLSIGYASDEINRVQKKENLRYPLIEWGFSESMCVKYLNSKSKMNPLYKNFNRLGCYFCPKQSDSALYVVWKLYPKFWNHMKELNKLNIELGCGVIPFGNEHKGIEYLEEQFNKVGYQRKDLNMSALNVRE
jgi:3'-phosphoadenosine 5'-phosphosulfate sulfotransferase (PAPS reductase)/FAD synthetase